MENLTGEVILKQLRNEPVQEKIIILPVHLVERGSVLPPR